MWRRIFQHNDKMKSPVLVAGLMPKRFRFAELLQWRHGYGMRERPIYAARDRLR